MRKIILIAATLLTVIIVVSVVYPRVTVHWPEVKRDPGFKQIVDDSLVAYEEQGRDYRIGLQDYDVFGDYLNYGQWKNYSESQKLTFDDNGVPKVKYRENFYYNPVTITQYALANYGKWLNENAGIAKEQFLTATDKLIDMQDESGAFRYNFPWKYYLTGETYQPGWVSGMAQGQALSALSRAYHLTKDMKYIDSGNKAIEFLVIPVEKGGTMSTLADLDPSLRDYIFFEEYVSIPNSYTLNGYMFALLGLYDWMEVTGEYQGSSNELAEFYFKSGIKTLINVLPYYDIGGFSAYDLGHMTFDKEPHVGVGYHAVHIYLLHALHSVTGQQELKYYEELWSSYVDEIEFENWRTS